MANHVTQPEVGQPAPSFEGTTQDGETLRLSDFKGKKVALYFYPKDDTPGCTKQACSLRDGYQELLANGVAVIGVSADPVDAHERFAAKYSLPFPLVADPDHDILDRYGVWGERSLYGRTFMGTSRTTFLIDEEGVIRHVIKRPKVDDHAQEVLAKFEQAGS
jgi:peroxiredoxin Q/BCP